MKIFQFKKLEIEQEGSWIKRTITSNHFKKTILFSVVSSLIGYGLFYFGQGAGIKVYWNDQAFEYVFMGLAFGIFITNSPCARGKC